MRGYRYARRSLYGTDAKFVKTSSFDSTILGDNPKHQLVFPQLYVNLYALIGNGMSVGHFYTIIGYESPMSPNQFLFLTRLHHAVR
ncbi:MAG: outer membrane beta-barrel protein [Nitrosomonas sp.]|nr:outer membrane beta-barrel protein [Nitrosomonas sp.]